MTVAVPWPSELSGPYAWTVPGKLMVAGEYAVLRDGGVAVACAVGRVVEVRVHPGAPRVATVTAFGKVAAAGWDDDPAAESGLLAFVTAGLAASERSGLSRCDAGMDFTVHAQVGAAKVGVGTSAAVTVAAVLAALGPGGLDAARIRQVTELAVAVHARLQGGRGSGYDIGAIAHGGAIAWHRTPDRATALPWPAGVCAAALWSGQPAATAEQLQRPAPDPAALDRIDAAARDLLQAWHAGGPPLLDAIRACEAAFTHAATGARHLANPALAALASLVGASGGIARTSGAGGGDCLIAWCSDRSQRTALVAAAGIRGFPCVALLPEDLAQPRARLLDPKGGA